MVVQLSGRVGWLASGGPGFESPPRKKKIVTLLTYLCPTSVVVKIESDVMPHTMSGTDYRPLLEILFDSGSSKCLDIRVRCTEAPPQVRNILQWEHLTPSNAPLPHSSCERREHFCSLDWHAWHERRVPGAHLPRSLLRKMPAMTQNLVHKTLNTKSCTLWEEALG